MAQLVDSNQQQLDIGQIVLIAAEQTGSKYPSNMVALTLLKELTMNNVEHLQLGNTLFVVHKLKNPRQMFFRALNADVAENYARSAVEFSRWAYEQGYEIAVTQFSDPAILNVIKFVAHNPPQPNMGYAVQKTTTDELRVTIKLGPPHEGD